MEKTGYVYILANRNRTVFYIGVTSNLIQRVWQHKQKLVPGFTKRYNAADLIYYEQFSTMYDAISREKQLKTWNRQWKARLISTLNPTREDLYPKLFPQAHG